MKISLSLVFSGLLFQSWFLLCAQNHLPSTFQNDSTRVTSTEINIGYGVVDKNMFAGALIDLHENDFNRGFLVSPFELLTGRIPGLIIMPNDGTPGGDFTLMNKGSNSFYAGSAPLVIVDDIPVILPLALDPEEIESIVFFRDGAAAGIFGEQAAHGALHITTKKGTNKLHAVYKGQAAAMMLPAMNDVFTSDEFRETIEHVYSGDTTVLNRLGNNHTDWQDEVYRNSLGQSHRFSLSGSPFGIPARISFAKTLENGIVKTSRYNRSAVYLALDPSLFSDHLKISVRLNKSLDKRNLIEEYVFQSAALFDPTQPVMEGDRFGGYFTWLINDDPSFMASRNPVAMLEQLHNGEEADRLNGSLKAEYRFHFLPDLTLGIQYGNNKYDHDTWQELDASASWARDYGNRYDERGITFKNIQLNYWLNYSKTIKNNVIHVLAGRSHYERERGYTRNSLTFNNEAYQSYYSSSNGLRSYFGRIIYSFAGKYIINFNFRADGNSRYSEKNRWAYLPSVAVAWKIISEHFISNTKYLSDLRIHASYGWTGSPDSYFVIQEGYQLNSNFDHDKRIIFNAGLDYGFFNNRISGTLDFFNNSGKGLAVPITYLPQNPKILYNSGSMVNQSMELQIHAMILKSKKWNWRISANATWLHNKVTRVSDDPDFINPTGSIHFGIGNTIQIQKTGSPVNTFYPLQQLYDAHEMPVEGLYADRVPDGNINYKDCYPYKQPDPGFVAGISSLITHNRWEFSFSGRVHLGNYVYNNINSISVYDHMSTPYNLSNVPASVEKSNFTSYQSISDYYIENASFFRMDFMQLAYHFETTGKIPFGITVTAGVQNAFVLTRYSGLDPEHDDGIDYYMYPRPRIASIGLKLEL